MFAAWYEKNGPAAEVMKTGELPDPEPGGGRGARAVACVGGEPVRRQGARRQPPDPLAETDTEQRRRRRHRPRGQRRDIAQESATACGPSTASGSARSAPARNILRCRRRSPCRCRRLLIWEQGACLGIPVMTAHRCLFADGPVKGKNCAGYRRRRRGRALRHPARQVGGGGERHHDREFRGKGGARARRRRRRRRQLPHRKRGRAHSRAAAASTASSTSISARTCRYSKRSSIRSARSPAYASMSELEPKFPYQDLFR